MNLVNSGFFLCNNYGFSYNDRMKEYDLYLFDFDGTIVDSLNSLIDVFALSFRAIGIEIDPNNVPRYMRIPLEETYTELNAPWDRAAEFEKAIRFYLNDIEVLKKTEMYPETKDFLRELHEKGKKFGIVTSNNEKHVLDVLDLFLIPSDWFCIFVDSDKVRETKPSPKPLLYALEELGYMDKRDRVVYVGDGINDMLAANRSEIDAVLIDRYDEFSDSEAYQKIHNLFELINN